MAKNDISKFRELLLTDADFQEKVRKAAEAYKGEQDEKSVFDKLLAPIGEEYGLSATYEEFTDYLSDFTNAAAGELSEDELAQVAGGKGDGGFTCALIGAGFGRTSSNPNDNCIIVGMGVGICFIEGASVD